MVLLTGWVVFLDVFDIFYENVWVNQSGLLF